MLHKSVQPDDQKIVVMGDLWEFFRVEAEAVKHDFIQLFRKNTYTHFKNVKHTQYKYKGKCMLTQEELFIFLLLFSSQQDLIITSPKKNLFHSGLSGIKIVKNFEHTHI